MTMFNKVITSFKLNLMCQHLASMDARWIHCCLEATSPLFPNAATGAQGEGVPILLKVTSDRIVATITDFWRIDAYFKWTLYYHAKFCI